MTTALLLSAARTAAVPAAVAGPVLMALIPFATLTGMMWFKLHLLRHRGRRVLIWLFAIVSFLLVFGVAAWSDALASLVSTEVDGGCLLGVDLVFGGLLYLHAVKKRHHEEHYHVVYSHAIAVVAGTALALTLADGLRLLRGLRSSPGETASAIGNTARNVNSGAAAHAAASHGGSTVLIVGVAIMLGLVYLGHRQHGTSWRPARHAATAQLPPGTSVKREKKVKAADDGQTRPGLPRGSAGGSAGSGFSPARRDGI